MLSLWLIYKYMQLPTLSHQGNPHLRMCLCASMGRTPRAAVGCVMHHLVSAATNVT